MKPKEPEIIHCKDCKHQGKAWKDMKGHPNGGFNIYWCELNTDPSAMHAVYGKDHEFCSSAKPKGE